MSWFKRIIRSIFTKLLLVIILTGICVNLVVGGFFWHYRSAAGQPLHKNVLQYLNYIVEDIGSPPDIDRARQIGAQAGLQIYFESPEQTWSIFEDTSRIEKAHWREWSNNPPIRLGRYHRHHFLELKHETGRFIFSIDKSFDLDPERKKLVVILLSLLTLILTGAFLSIRWILKPVRWLNEGVQEVSRGNLKHRVPLKRSDELRDLASAFNDMTERIRDMLHTKEQLLLDVSHEMRSPLTRVKVALEFLPDSQAKKSIAADIAEMEKMINNILETARMHHLHGKLKKESVILADLLSSLLTEFDDLSPGVLTDGVSADISINADPEQIKTVIKNILTNAVKFSDPESNPVHITVKHRAQHVIVKIVDNGIGIPPDELPFIFEPFYRVDKSRTKDTGGYGLGLSLCKTIMEAHGGRIEIESTPDVGTTVTLIFPE